MKLTKEMAEIVLGRGLDNLSIEDTEALIRVAEKRINRVIAMSNNSCTLPPYGWKCTRPADHEGPCAAVEAPKDVALIDDAVVDSFAQQEPVAWYCTLDGEFWDLAEKIDEFSPKDKGFQKYPLYLHPAPQQADRQRVPDGWKLVPVEPGEWVFADKVLGHDSHPNHKERMRRLYRAMLAAAPEAPAQASAVDERAALEAWYSQNAFNFERDPIGSRDCGLQWKAWQARAALERKPIHGVSSATKSAPLMTDDIIND